MMHFRELKNPSATPVLLTSRVRLASNAIKNRSGLLDDAALVGSFPEEVTGGPFADQRQHTLVTADPNRRRGLK